MNPQEFVAILRIVGSGLGLSCGGIVLLVLPRPR